MFTDLKDRGVDLLMPSFVVDKHLSLGEARWSRLISSARVHIERLNERLKRFAWFDAAIPASSFATCSIKFFVCVHLTRFMGASAHKGVVQVVLAWGLCPFTHFALMLVTQVAGACLIFMRHLPRQLQHPFLDPDAAAADAPAAAAAAADAPAADAPEVSTVEEHIALCEGVADGDDSELEDDLPGSASEDDGSDDDSDVVHDDDD